MKKYSIAIAGTTKRTTLCAEALNNSDKFEISWILTPNPKTIGRKKTITANPVDLFGKENDIYTIYIDKKIDDQVKEKVNNKIRDENRPDFLLVVDFGYIVPSWLLKLSKIAPLNIHPSALPKWRGSSPGQFSILFNDKRSAVSLMVINDKLDQGPIVHQDSFKVGRDWTHADYYEHAFELMCENLDQKIAKFAQDPGLAQTQPEKSPTLIAKTLNKDQTFVEWEVVKMAMNGQELDKHSEISSKLITIALEHNRSLSLTLERASKAFNPWPHLWTKVPTKKGEKRMKLIELEVEKLPDTSGNKLKLKTVQVEGKNPCTWGEIKNIVT